MPTLKSLLIPLSEIFFASLKMLDAWRGGLPVSEMTIEQLRKKLAESSGRQGSDYVVVDVRSDQEHQISKIPDAISRNDFEQKIDRYRDKNVITYCTAGGRSYLYSRKLAKQGFHTTNLKPGIIGWCNAELPLTTSTGQPTNHVHLNGSALRVPSKYEVAGNPHRKRQRQA